MQAAAAVAVALVVGGAACRKQPSADPGARWDDGARQVYDVKLSSLTEMGAGNVLVDFRLVAGLELYAGRGADGVVELTARLRDAKVDGTSSGGDVKLADLARVLGQPWIIELRGGRVEALRLPAGAPAAVAGIARTLAAALQLAPRPAKGDGEWTATEHDATGRYAASYTALPEAGRFAKRKLRYESLLLGVSDLRPGVKLGPGTGAAPPEIGASSGEIEVGADGTLRLVRSQDEIRAKLATGAPVSSKTTLALTLSAADRAPRPADVVASVGGGLLRLRAGDPYAPPAAPLKLDAAKAAGWTFERALAEIEELERTREPAKPVPAGGDPEAQTADETARAQRMANAFMGLTAILRREPDKIRRATAIIRRNGPVAQALLDALSSATTGASQGALLEIARDRKLPEPLRKAAAGSLIRSDQPSEEAVAGLIKLLDDPLLDVHATYGLGTFARKLRHAGEAERAKLISELLVRRLEAAREQQQKVTVLRGIANSAYVGALPGVRPYLASDNPFLRAAAVEALRLMDHPEVDGLIAARLAGQESPIVRMAALNAATPRAVSATLVTAVGGAAAQSPDAHGRLQAVRLLARWLPEQTSAVRPALEQAARADAEPKVREEASRALKRL